MCSDLRAAHRRQRSANGLPRSTGVEIEGDLWAGLEALEQVADPETGPDDPFLRPLFATLLQAVGLYGYGYEKSYSRRTLRLMLERAVEVAE